MKRKLLFLVCMLCILSASAQSFVETNDQFNELYKKGMYKEAIPVGIKAVELARKEYGAENNNYAVAAHNLGSGYYALKEWRAALPWFHEAIRAYTAANKSNETNSIAFCSNNIGNIHLVLKNHDSAAMYYESAFAYFLKHIDTEYDNAIGMVYNLQDLYIPLKRYSSARAVQEKILPEVEKKETIVDDNYQAIFLKHVFVMYLQQDYASIETTIKKVLPQVEQSRKKLETAYCYIMQYFSSSLKLQDKNREALQYYKKAIDAFNENGAVENGSNIAYCNNDIGSIYFSFRQYDSSISYFEKSVTYYSNNIKKQYDNFLSSAGSLVSAYNKSNSPKKEIALLKQVLTIIESEEGVQTENYCLYLSELCGTMKAERLFEENEQLTAKLVSITEKLNGPNSKQYAEALDLAGRNYIGLLDLKKAEALLLKSLAIKKKLAKVDPLSMVVTLVGLGELYSTTGNFKYAYEYYNQAVSLCEQTDLLNSAYHLQVSENLGSAYIDGGRFAEAKSIFEKTLVLRKKAEGETSLGNAETYISLAKAEYNLNELSAAKEHAENGVQLFAYYKKDSTYDMCTAKQVLGTIYLKTGSSNKGIKLLEDALTIAKKATGEKSSKTASVQANLAVFYQEMGRYADAEVLLVKSRDIRKAIYGEMHPKYANSLLNLSNVYIAQAKYLEALAIVVEALDILTKSDGSSTNDYASILNNLATISARLGDYKKAKEISLQLFTKFETRGDSTSKGSFAALEHLVVACLRLEQYEEAAAYAEKHILYAKRIFGNLSMEHANALNSCAIAYEYLNNLPKAEALFTEAITVYTKNLGDNAEPLVAVYMNAAVLYIKQHRPKLAFDYQKKGLDILLNNLKTNLYTLSENEKLSWWWKEGKQFTALPSLWAEFPAMEKEVTEHIINQQLQLKGLILNDGSNALRRARTSGNKALITLLDDWQSCRTLLSKQLALPINQRYYNMDSLQKAANNFEKSINQQAAGLLDAAQSKPITWQAVQSALKEDEAAVEFVRFPFYRKNVFTDTVYYAAIITSKKQAPKLVLLGSEQQINWCLTGGKKESKQTRINTLYRSTIKAGSSNETFAGDSLYNIVWKPLLPYLEGIKTVSYSPDGLLHKVAFHALPMAKDRLLLDEFQLQQYASTRQIAGQNSGPVKWADAYLMGNADFNTLSSTASAEGMNVGFSGSSSNNAWAALQGTQTEINTLQPLLVSKGVHVSLSSGTAATEEKFKSFNGKAPSIIHLATHGFFLPDPQTKKQLGMTVTENSYGLSDEPLMRSGVIMAGANKAWSGEKVPPTVEDGIVTAYEIAQMDLSNTQLVVLSACETALGDVQGTEGVFGLQRAFKTAGVKNLIVSLWQVPDKETAEMMGIFYRHLLTGIPIREAFHKTQKEMRSKYAPYSWAAFVLVE